MRERSRDHHRAVRGGPKHTTDHLARHRLLVESPFAGDDYVGTRQHTVKAGERGEIVSSGCDARPPRGGEPIRRAARSSCSRMRGLAPQHRSHPRQPGFELVHIVSAGTLLRPERSRGTIRPEQRRRDVGEEGDAAKWRRPEG